MQTLCSISCGATVVLQGILGNAHTVQYLVQSFCCSQGIVGNVDAVQHLLKNYCSSTANSRKYAHCVASPVELLQLQREYQEICTLYSISYGATVVLQEILRKINAMQHLLWSYCSLTGNNRKRADCVGNSRKHATVKHLLGSCCRSTRNSRKRSHCVASPVGLLSLYKEQQIYYSPTGNTRKHIYCEASPVKLLQLYREQMEMHTLCRILCRATVALQGIRKRTHCVVSPVELLQLCRE